MHPKICTIIFPWGKYSYKRFPMGITGSPDNFQGKISKPMESLKYVWAYLDDLLCISRSSLENHLEKLDKVLRGLCNAGVKVKAEKLTFCAFEIEYLGYILTRDGIKPQSNKVQAILAIKPPTGVKQLRHFPGMVQYYRDLWARRSKMLAPLTSLVGECGETKIKRAKGTKKVPWIGSRSIKEFWSRKGYYCKRSGLCLSGLFKSVKDLHRCFKQKTRSSNYSGQQADCIL